ncbi:DUF1440 domain-containing protein [Sesbania bispinosa]|nr:DUF1440 domain-containing protein [Sesbania bispinosa]
MTWTHGARWAYDAERGEIRYRGWLNLLIYHHYRHRAVVLLPFRIPLELTFLYLLVLLQRHLNHLFHHPINLHKVLGNPLWRAMYFRCHIFAFHTWPFPRPRHARSSQPAMEAPEDEEEDLREEEEPENESSTRSNDAVVSDVGSGGPEDP